MVHAAGRWCDERFVEGEDAFLEKPERDTNANRLTGSERRCVGTEIQAKRVSARKRNVGVDHATESGVQAQKNAFTHAELQQFQIQKFASQKICK
jgi:hypothetical protein